MSADPAWTSPSGGAWTYRFTGLSAKSSPVSTNDDGVIFGYTDLQNLHNYLVCVDRDTSHVRWKFNDEGFAGPWEATPCVEGDVVYAPNLNGGIYAIDVRTGERLWTYSGGVAIETEPIYTNGRLLCGNTIGTFFALNAANGLFEWSYQGSVKSTPALVTRPVVTGNFAIFAASSTNKDHVSGHVYAFDMAAGFAKTWDHDAKIAVTTDGTAAQDLVLYGCSDGKCIALHAANGTEAWHYKTSKAILGAPAADDTYAFFASTDGVFYARALRDDVSLREWQAPVTESIPTGIVTIGGEAFFAGVSSDQRGAMYTLNLASAEKQAAKVLVDQLEGAVNVTPTLRSDQLSFLVRGQGWGGVVYSIDVATTQMIDRVNFTSTLIVGTYDEKTGQPGPPVFQMTATLLDANATPVPNAQVAIWASEPDATVTWRNQRYPLGVDVNTAATFTTDANGQVALEADGNLGSPSLFLRPLTTDWTQGYSLQVFPDQANVDTLSSLSDSDLTDAKDWDGQNVLKPKYTSSAGDIASAVRSSVGRTQNVSSVRLTTAMSGTMANVQRSVLPAEAEHWSLSIDHEEETAKFEVLPPPDPATLTAAGFDLGDYIPFYNDVVKGHDKVTKVTWHYMSDGAHAIVEAAGKTYRFVVHTVEQAVSVVISIIKDVVTAIEKFIQWLSFLFEWQDIIDTKDAIRDAANDSFQALETWVKQTIAKGTSEIHAQIADWRQNVDSYFDKLAVELTGKTIGSTQRSGGSSGDVFEPAGVDITEQSQWLMRKISDGIVPTPHAWNELETALQKYKDTVTTIVANDPALANLEADLLAVFTSYSKLFTDPGGYAAQELNTVLAIFRDITNLLLAFLDAALEATLELFASVITYVRQTLEASIDVGFVSDFYKLLTGKPLSLLDLGALILAVPTTLTYKILHDGKKPVTKVGATDLPEWVKLAGAFSYFPMIPLWSMETNGKLLNGLVAADSWLLQGLAIYPLVHGNPTGDDWVFWAIQFFQPLLLTFGVGATGALWKSASAFYFAALSAIYIGVAAVYAVKYPDDYNGHGVDLCINLFSATPLASPLIAELGEGNVYVEDAAFLNSNIGYSVAGVLTYFDVDDIE